MNRKVLIAVALAIASLASLNCTLDPCPGQVACSDGTCAPAGYICCGNGTSCPPNAPVCGVGVCYSSQPSGCLASGEETCVNTDGTEDCAPIGADCCGNHKFCPAGTVCINGGTSCSP